MKCNADERCRRRLEVDLRFELWYYYKYIKETMTALF